MQINFERNISTKINKLNFKGLNKSPDVSSYIDTDNMVDTFIRIAQVDTGSDEALAEVQIPSTNGQKDLARILKQKLEQLNLMDVEIDEHSIVTATLASNVEGDSPVVGIFAHMDTSPDAPTANVKPQIHDYTGGDIKLEEGTIIPEGDLKKYIGQKIITSDGKTLLGADDKAGIAEILEALRVLQAHPEIKRPKIRVAFTPDEETGVGIHKFNIKTFGADLAYTVDGDFPHIIENESFNAFNPEIIINGRSTHCGDAKAGRMINSIKVANWIMSKLPKNQAPETTDKKQGYYHVDEIKGSVSQTKLNMLVRDHNFAKAKSRMSFLEQIVDSARTKFHCEIQFNPKERYHNMREKLDEFPEVVRYAREGIKLSGLIPETKAIRGGTDGSNLSLRGLPTPNIGAGGHNFHSKSEFLPIEEMKKCTENIINILSIWAEKSAKIMPKIIARR